MDAHSARIIAEAIEKASDSFKRGCEYVALGLIVGAIIIAFALSYWVGIGAVVIGGVIVMIFSSIDDNVYDGPQTEAPPPTDTELEQLVQID